LLHNFALLPTLNKLVKKMTSLDPNKDILLDVSNLNVTFELKNASVKAVDNVSFYVKKGEFLAVVGESGCGKSVSSLSILKLLPEKIANIQSKHLIFDGEDISNWSSDQLREIRGKRISMIFQEPMTSLNPVLTIGDQITEPLITHLNLSVTEANIRAIELMEMVGIPEPKSRLTQYPHQFSGGMRQRVMIAIGLACQPDLIIADEPTTALDVTIQAQILELLKDISNRLGIAVIMITHNLGVVAAYADRVNVMYAGRIIETGTSNKIFKKPTHPYTIGLLRSVPRLDQSRKGKLATIDGLPPNLMNPPTGCRFYERCPIKNSDCKQSPSLIETSPKELASVACWHFEKAMENGSNMYASSEENSKSIPDVNAKPIIEIKNLKQHFNISLRTGWLKTVSGKVKAVDDISFSIQPGETVGLVGESGCGKTSVGRSILHLNDPTSGDIKFKGIEMNNKSIALVRRDMQVIFQDPFSSLNPRMTIGEILDEPLRVHKIIEDKEKRKEKIDKLLGQVGLYTYMSERYPHELSGGQRQRVGIARALSMEPKLIICDEPVSALDVSVQAQIINLLEDLQKELGLSYLFIAHDLAVVRHISHKVIVMYLGKIMEVAEESMLYSNPQHPYTKALLDAAPVPDPEIEKNRKRIILKGELPSPLNPPKGCVFSSRCPKFSDECSKETPELAKFKNDHFVSCIKV
jgi:peptide/nickel transport system ATP-binding protein